MYIVQQWGLPIHGDNFCGCYFLSTFTFHMYNGELCSGQMRPILHCNSPPLSTIGTHFSRIFQHISRISNSFLSLYYPIQKYSFCISFNKTEGFWGNFIFITRLSFHIILAKMEKYRLNFCVWVKVEVVEFLVLNARLILGSRHIRHD